VIDVANDTLSQYCHPALRLPTVRSNSTRSDVLRLARRRHTSRLLVIGDSPRDILGYVRIIDVHLTKDDWQTVVRPLTKVRRTDSHLRTLLRLQEKNEPLAQVVDNRGHNVGIVDSSDLLQALFGQRG
jgi:CBS domain containing-hemolysin-like protein